MYDGTNTRVRTAGGASKYSRLRWGCIRDQHLAVFVFLGNGRIDATHLRGECWPVKNSHVQQMKVAETRMLRWKCGHTRLDRIRNEVIRDKMTVTPMEEKIQEARLRWFGHVKRRSTDALVKRCERLALGGKRKGRGRPKKSSKEVIRRDMEQLELTDDITLDRRVWRLRIRV
ncbi:uncharacterized protein [Nicotiana sylvestris]|uniref:uncharacterized protein n=1 Tax=Nicotiana sylvestris TaxID=4096 RepID=UPI00388C51C7